MNKRFYELFALCLLLFAFESVAQRRFRVMEYNVENLFDTIHAEGHQDEEFTPSGSKRWSEAKYWGKLSRISRVIAAVGGEAPVDLVALVEVENDSVLSNLTQRTKLRRLGYEYVVTHSLDTRGINVALLYQPAHFRPFGIHTLRIAPPSKTKLAPTRDILHVAGELVMGDTLDVFVCHFPSRRMEKLSAKYRMKVAQTLRHYADSVMHHRNCPYLLLTGDFNSWYPEKDLLQGLGVQLPDSSVSRTQLYILSHNLSASSTITGTYRFQGEWNQLDHFIVSGSFLSPWPGRTLSTRIRECRIVNLPFLLKKVKNKSLYTPYRTFLGNYYQGGFSDHLPLVLDLYF